MTGIGAAHENAGIFSIASVTGNLQSNLGRQQFSKVSSRTGLDILTRDYSNRGQHLVSRLCSPRCRHDDRVSGLN